MAGRPSKKTAQNSSQRSGGGGSSLSSLISNLYGSNVGLNPNYLSPEDAAASQQAKAAVVDDPSKYEQYGYQQLNAKGTPNRFQANNFLSKGTANRANLDFLNDRLKATGAIQDSLTQAKGMIPIDVQRTQQVGDVDTALQKQRNIDRINEQIRGDVGQFAATHGLNATDPDTMQKYFQQSKDPIISQLVQQATASGAKGQLDATNFNRENTIAQDNDLPLRITAQNQVINQANQSGFDLLHQPETSKADLNVRLMQPDKLLADTQQKRYIPGNPGSIFLDTSTGQSIGQNPSKPSPITDIALHGGAGLLSPTGGAPLTNAYPQIPFRGQQPQPLNQQSTQQPNANGQQYVRLQDGSLQDPFTKMIYQPKPIAPIDLGTGE